MQQFLMVLHILIAFCLIGLILIQHGKGADAGAAFGSGASATVFGARGSASFLTHTTAILAALFFIISIGLNYFAGHTTEQKSLMQKVEQGAGAGTDKANVDVLETKIEPLEPAAEGATEGGEVQTDVPVVPGAPVPASPSTKVAPTAEQAPETGKPASKDGKAADAAPTPTPTAESAQPSATPTPSAKPETDGDNTAAAKSEPAKDELKPAETKKKPATKASKQTKSKSATKRAPDTKKSKPKRSE
jgi:preprotein translocase subunit SecG